MKLLVLASAPVGPAEIREALGDQEGIESAEVRVIAPAINQSALAFFVSDSDEAIEEAKARAAQVAEVARDEGAAKVTSDTGESEPLLALQDALATFPADHVLIVASEGDDEGYREDDVAAARERTGVPVTLVRRTT